MATHDYVIANQSGAAFRTDLNNALAAIVSNNSSSTEPSTKYAYQWWADTNTGILKIRNSANDGWVELLQLDGTLTLEDGSASTPALAFRDDLNTGIFSSAADTFNVATGGVERLELGTTTVFNEDGADVDFRIEGDTNTALFFVDAGTNRVCVGSNAPQQTFHVVGDSGSNTPVKFVRGGSSVAGHLYSDGGGSGIVGNDGVLANTGIYLVPNTRIDFRVGGSERLRIDSDGIKFNGDTAAVNALDDYEEGTFSFLLNGGNFAATQNHMRYTKIGRQVTVSGQLVDFSSSTNSSTMSMSGLPFTMSSSAASAGAVAFKLIDIPSGLAQISCVASQNTTNMFFNVSGTGSTQDANLKYSDLNSTSASLIFSFTYTV